MTLDSTAVEICPVALPGREHRFAEPMPPQLDALADHLAEELAPTVDRPYGLLGYSMGALLSVELVRRWRSRGLPEPDLMTVIAARAPHLPLDREPPFHQLDAEGFKQALLELGGTPIEILNNPEAMAFFEPVLRQDFANCELHEFQAFEALTCDINVFVGDDDSLVSIEDATEWKTITSGPFSLTEIRGGHLVSPQNMRQIFEQTLRSLSAK